LSGKPFGLPSDVYAFGIMMWEVLTRKHPYLDFDFDSDKEVAIIKGTRPPIPPECPKPYADLMTYVLSLLGEKMEKRELTEGNGKG
jgi:serine/threonine protein kinase